MNLVITEVSVVWQDKEKKVSLIEQIPDGDEEIKGLSKYWIRNALGNKVYIKANCRDLAQLAIDTEYKKGFYRVNSDKGDSPKGDVTVRATAYRKGQTAQRNKAKILNS